MEARNPYAAPTASVVDPSTDYRGAELAGRVRRFLNLVIDTFLYVLVSMIVAIVASGGEVDVENIPLVYRLLTPLVYYVFFEAIFGRTPGKLITRTRVVTENGTRPSFRQIVLRSAARLVPFEPLSCLSDPPIGWHDQWSDTRVILVGVRTPRGPAYSLGHDVDPPSTSILGLGR